MDKFIFKEEAKQKLHGQYLKIIIFLVVTTVIVGLLIYLSGVFSFKKDDQGRIVFLISLKLPLLSFINVITFIFGSAFAYSRASVFIDVLNGKDIDLFQKFKLGFVNELVRSVILVFVRNIKVIFWSLLLLIPGIIKSYSYSMAIFLTHKKPSIGPIEALSISKDITVGYKKGLFLLDLSFVWLYFVGVLTLGILWLWIIPKHLTARTFYFQAILEKSDLYSEELDR
jgi:uncharacterized membrane protein